jgi:hypothetical protein
MAVLDRATIEQELEREAREQGVNPKVARAILRAENGGARSIDTETTSPAGAVGILQVMPDTLAGLRRLGFIPQDLDYSTPQGQIKAGVAAIKERMSAGITSPVDLAVSFNGSPAVYKAFKAGQPVPAETTKYIANFTKAFGGDGMADDAYDDSTPGVTPVTRVANKGTATGQSFRTSSTFSVLPADIEEGIMTSMNRASGLIDQLLVKIPAYNQQIEDITKQQTEAQRRMGVAASQVAVTKGDIEIADVKNRENILSTYGININSKDEAGNLAQQQALATIKQMEAIRGPLADQIAVLKGTNPLDDPAGWLVNNFKALGLEQTYNAVDNRQKIAIDHLNQIQALATKQAAIQPADVTESIQLRSYAEAQYARAKATADIAQTESAAKQHIARSMTEQLNLVNADLSHRFAAARLYQEKFSLSQADVARTKAEKEEQDYFNVLNMFGDTFGMKPLNKISIKLFDKETMDSFARAAHTGSFQNMGEAVSTMHKLIGDNGFADLQKKSPVLGDFLVDAVKGGQAELDKLYEKDRTNGTSNPLFKVYKTDKERLELGIDLWQKAKEEELLYKDYSKLSVDNPRKIDYARANTLPELASNSVTTLTKNFKGVVSDELIINNAVGSALNDPSTIPKLAQDIATYYRTATESRAGSQGLSQYGWKKEKSIQYPVFYNKSKIDMFNPAQIEQQLTIQYATNAAYAAGIDPMGLGAPVAEPAAHEADPRMSRETWNRVNKPGAVQ